jgi:hypothetical protein
MKKSNFASLRDWARENRQRIKAYKLIPNVAEYTTEFCGYHLTALLYGIEKVIRKIYVRKLDKKARYNKYAERQLLRLSKYASEGQLEKYLYLQDILMTKSEVFRLINWIQVDKEFIHHKASKLDRIWRKITKLCTSRSSNLNYKRVWISDPGKSEKYTRPLGVPTLEWRVYSRMKLDIIERWFKGKGLLASWQHGGRSKVGTLSCYKEVLPKYLQYKNIYEFDIKGFFNNVSHEVITSLFKEYFRSQGIIEGFLNSKPNKYVMPPKEEDPVHLLGEIRHEYDKQVLVPQEKYYWKNRLKVIVESFEHSARFGKDVTEWAGALPSAGPRPLASFFEGLKRDRADYYAKRMERLGLYDTHTAGIRRISDRDAELGRDKWKGLGQEGKGVPQGLGTSPLLSTLTTDLILGKSMPKNSITMYMDDGLLFSNKPIEAILNKLKEGLGKIGLEIEPKKSEVIKQDGRWLKSVKFLGLRYDGSTNEIMSDTRGGTRVKFPERLKGEELYEWIGHNTRLWNEVKTHYTRLRDVKLSSWEAGIKDGFLGTLIANSQYKNMAPIWARKLEISCGQHRAWKKALRSNSILLWQNALEREETLTNLTSIAAQHFLRIRRCKMTVKRYERMKYGYYYDGPLNRNVRRASSAIAFNGERL